MIENFYWELSSEMSFDLAYQKFVEYHGKARTGERLRMLKEGMGHLEIHFLQKVWWPAFGHFQGLHPQYEVRVRNGGLFFVDFAWIERNVKVAVELDGFRSHAHNIDRNGFAYQLKRQNELVLDGWRVLRFTSDQVHSQPYECRKTLQFAKMAWFDPLEEAAVGWLTVHERYVLSAAIRSVDGITLRDVEKLLDVKHETARRILRKLAALDLIQPVVPGRTRIHRYAVNPLLDMEKYRFLI